jgi:hypothetical protein
MYVKDSSKCFHKSTLLNVQEDNGESVLKPISSLTVGSRVLALSGKYESLLIKLTHEEDNTL